MKLTSCVIALSFLPLIPVVAQEAEKPATELSASQREFTNLPEQTRIEFIKAVGEAQRLFAQKRVFEAIDKGTKALEIFKHSPDLHNLLGACQTEFRNFDKAMEHFKEADRLAPNQPAIVFNLGELHFVKHDFAEAEKTFTRVLELSDLTKHPEQLQLHRLVEFKILLCKLKTGDKDGAVALSKKYDYLDDSPFPYYAEAAIAFDGGKDLDAEAAMARATRIFQDPNSLSAWQDTMIEYGYIKGFFGGDEAGDADE